MSAWSRLAFLLHSRLLRLAALSDKRLLSCRGIPRVYELESGARPSNKCFFRKAPGPHDQKEVKKPGRLELGDEGAYWEGGRQA